MLVPSYIDMAAPSCKVKMKTKRSKTNVFKTMFKSKRGIQVRGKWSPVEIDPDLFSEENMGGLICFEELRDYKLVDSTFTEEKKGKKRKLAVEEDCNPEVSDGQPKQPAKKKKKKKSQTQKVEPGTGIEADGETAVAVPPVDDDSTLQEDSIQTQTQLKKKKKKKKKSQTQKMEPVGDTEIGNEADGEDAEDVQGVPQVEDMSSLQEDGIQTQAQPKKKRKKNKTVAEPQVAELPKPKQKVKNWTSAALSGSGSQMLDTSAWKDLFIPEPVLQALSSLGFKAPTPIQALALPPAIRDHMDILGAAETGSGKTLAFGIPMINAILEWRKAKDGQSEEMIDNPKEHGREVGAVCLSGPEPQETPADGDSDGDSEEDWEGDSHSQKLGCVKVIEDMEFDFSSNQETNKSKMEDKRQNPLLGLVLTPTRELAVQVKHHLDAVAMFTGIKTAIVVGGMAPQKQARVLNRRPEIVIATPGRLWELIKERHPHLSNLKRLRCLVIDEADRMVEKGHFAELESLLEMLNDVQFNPMRQNFVFSATLTMVHQTPARILQKKKGKRLDQRSKLELLMERVGIRDKPKVIDLTRKQATVETLTETRIHCDTEEKDFYLYYFLLQYPGRTMVFANSIDCIKRLNSLLTILDCTPLPLHANMHQKQRLKNLERFAERDSCVLLTTDVAARGLDIPDVQHVIHYQVPRTSETYVHRSGRTARATKQGLSLLLIGPDDVMNFRKIYRTLGKDEELPMFPVQSKCMVAIKERVNLARKIEKIEYHNNRAKHHNSWFQQAAEALEIDLDDDLLIGKRKDEYEDKQHQQMVKGMKKHLKHVLSQPIFKTMMKTKYPTQMGRLPVFDLPAANVERALDTVSNQKQKKNKHKK
ncbi:ATP-dependent RNA helicase DDX24 isoform X1 [Lepisosteus oculatus]|uniref:ATP-dependent RNA helicase DDX24 isoform X1 n=1 Tax=Lepisosteus oculatus TaxID=7918 RepID=UPI00371763C2